MSVNLSGETARDFASEFDQVQSGEELDAAFSLLADSLNGQSFKETLAFLRQIDNKERNGAGADISVSVGEDGRHYLKVSSPFRSTEKIDVSNF